MRKSQSFRPTMGMADWLTLGLIVLLWVTNPGFQAFNNYLNQESALRLEPKEKLILELADWVGRFEVCRRNCLIFSFYTISYQPFLGRETEVLLCLGVGGEFYPVGFFLPSELGWLRSYNCRAYDT